MTISHIVITTNGVALSSNLIRYCVSNKIPIDFFDFPDVYYGSFFSPKFMESTIWQQQAIASQKQRCELAMYILGGKIRNQLNLVKYYHKYHKHLPNRLADRFEEIKAYVDNFIEFKKTCDYSDTHTTMQKLLTYESQTAVKYWAYIKELLADDKSVFECMLTKAQLNIVIEELEIISIVKFDSIAIYPICAECYAKAKYIPKHLRIMPKGNTIVVP